MGERHHVSEGAHGAIHALQVRAEEAKATPLVASELFAQAGVMCETLAGDKGWAFRLYTNALQHNAHNTTALSGALRIADDPARPVPDALESLEGLSLDHILGPGEQLCLEAELRLSARDEERELALALLDEAVDAEGVRAYAALMLSDCLEEDNDHEGLADLARRQAQFCEDDDLRCLYWSMAGKLTEDTLSPEGATLYLKEALQCSPKNAALHAALRRCLRRAGNYAELTTHLARSMTMRSDPTARVASAYEVAALRAWRLGDQERGLEVLQQAIRDLQSQPKRSGQQLDLQLAHELSARLARDIGENEELLELRELVQYVTSRSRRAVLLTRIGQILAEKRQSKEGGRSEELAIQYLETALSESWCHSATTTLEELYKKEGLVEKQCELLVRRSIEEEHVDLLMEAAALSLNNLNAAEHAMELSLEAVKQSDEMQILGPKSPILLMRHAPMTTTAEKKGWLKIGEEALSKLKSRSGCRRLLDELTGMALAGGLVEEATDLLVQSIDLEPTDLYERRRLSSILERAGDWPSLIELKQQEQQILEKLNPAQALEIMTELAEIVEHRLGEPEGALKWFGAVLLRKPDALGALVGAGRILSKQGRWEELAELYRNEMLMTDSSSKEASRAFRLGLLLEQDVGAQEEAANCYEQVLQCNRNHLPSHMGLLRTSERLGRWRRWAELVGEWALRAENDALAAALYCEQGEVYEDRLGNVEAALHAYRNALRLNPKLEPAHLNVVRTLSREGQAMVASEVMMEQCYHDLSPKARLDVLSTASMFADDELASAVQVLQEFPKHLPSLLKVFRCNLEKGTSKLAAACAREIAGILPSAQPLSVAFERLSLMLERLEGRALNHEMIRELLMREEVDEVTLLELEAELRNEGDLEGLARVMELRSKSASGARERASYKTAYGRYLHVRGRLEQASEVYQSALKESPGFLPAIKALKLLQEQTGDRPRLVLTYELEGAVSQSPTLVVDDFLKASELRRRYLGDLESAASDLKEVLRQDPAQREAYTSLREIYSMRDEPQALYALYKQRSEASVPKAERKEMLLRMGEVAFSRLNNNMLTLEAHKALLELDKGHIPSYRILAEVYEAEGRWEEAVGALREVVDLVKEPTLLARIYRTMARIYDEQLRDYPQAIETYRCLVKSSPKGQIEGMRRLAQLYHAQGEWESSAKTYGSLLKVERRHAKLTEDLLALSKICFDGLGEPERGEQCLSQALRLEPLDLGLVQTIAEMLKHYRRSEKRSALLLQTSRAFAHVLSEGQMQHKTKRHKEALEGLFRVACWGEEWDRAFVVSRVSELLGVEFEKQREMLMRAKRSGMETVPKASIPAELTDGTIPSELSASVLKLLRMCDALVGKMFAMSGKEYGATRRNRLSERDKRQGGRVINRWSELFSVQKLPIHVVEARGDHPVLVPGEQASLVIPRGVMGAYAAGDGEALFALGCEIAPVSMGVAGWHGLSEELYCAVFGTLVQVFAPSFLVDDRRLEHPHLDRERFVRYLGRLPENAMMPHALRVSSLGSYEALQQQRRALRTAFRRLALIPIYDPGPALTSVNHDAMVDLVGFLLDERTTSIRKAIGIALV